MISRQVGIILLAVAVFTSVFGVTAFASLNDDIATKACSWLRPNDPGLPFGQEGRVTHFLLGGHGYFGWYEVQNGIGSDGRAILNGEPCLSFCGNSGTGCSQVVRHHFDCVGFVCQVFRDLDATLKYRDLYLGGEPWMVHNLYNTLRNQSPINNRWRWHGNPYNDVSETDIHKLFSWGDWLNLHKGDIVIFCPPKKYWKDGGWWYSIDPNQVVYDSQGRQIHNHCALCVDGSADTGGPAICNSRPRHRQWDPPSSECCSAEDSGVIRESLQSFLVTAEEAWRNRETFGLYPCSFKGSGLYGYFELIGKSSTHFDCAVPPVKCGFATSLCVILKDSAGNPIPNAHVRLEIQGKVEEPLTGSDGKACIKWIPPAPGNYTLHASFTETDDYEASSKDCDFSVNPIPTSITVDNVSTNCSDPFSLRACLRDADGQLVKGAASLRFEVDGKAYSPNPAIDLTTGCAEIKNIYDCLRVGTHQIKVSWRDDSLACYLPSTGTGTLTVNCDPTDITDETANHAVQYSDPITLSARIKDDEGLNLSGKWLGFTMGTQSAFSFSSGTGPLGCQPDNDLTGRNGLASVEIICNQPATKEGCIPITTTAKFDGDNCYCTSSKNIPVEIKCEDATIETTWNPLFQCTNTVTLTAKISEAQDGYLGDITKSGPLVFDIVDFWDRPVSSLKSAVTQTEPGVGQASITTTLSEGVYYVTVRPESECYYCAAGVDQCAVVFCDGFVTGGGWITCPDGEKKNFGFNVKYKKTGTLPQGSLQFVDHGTKLNFHSTNMYGVTVYPHPDYPNDPKKGIAVFWGKGSIKGQGTFDFTAEVWDSGEPGTEDKFSLRLTPINSNGLDLICPDNDYCPINSDGSYYIAPCLLSGGNIQLHSK